MSADLLTRLRQGPLSADEYAEAKPGFDVEARVAADQAKRRARKEHWLELERDKYCLPQRGRLIDDMPA
jgi:hypothetical protein